MMYKINKLKMLDALIAHKQREYAKVISERKAKRLQDEIRCLFSQVDALYWSQRYKDVDPWTFETIYDSDK